MSATAQPADEAGVAAGTTLSAAALPAPGIAADDEARAAAGTASAAERGATGSAEAGPRANVPLLALLTLSHLVVDAYATTVPALLPFWQARFGLTYGLSGLITGIGSVTSSVAQPLVGMLADRGRNPRWIVLSCLVAAAGISATGLVPSYPLFLALVVLGGL